MTDDELHSLSRPHAEEAPKDPSRNMQPLASFETAAARPPQDDGDRRRRHPQKKRDKRDVHGWVVLDKPVGMTSTHAVSIIKRLFSAKRCGHAGTLDPLASGALPIALGEATKTVPFVMD